MSGSDLLVAAPILACVLVLVAIAAFHLGKARGEIRMVNRAPAGPIERELRSVTMVVQGTLPLDDLFVPLVRQALLDYACLPDATFDTADGVWCAPNGLRIDWISSRLPCGNRWVMKEIAP